MTADHSRRLAADGYTIVPNVLSDAELERGRRLLDALYDRSDPQLDAPGISLQGGRAAGREAAGAASPARRFITNLVSKDAFFAELMTRAPILELVRRTLGDDCVLSSMNSLEPLPGQPGQELHRDEGPAPPEGAMIANTLWAFDDMDAGNGATRLIPGTHATDELAGDDDPRLLYAEASAGSVIVTNAHVLHAASPNLDGRRRRVVHVFYTRRGRPTQTDWPRYVPASVTQRLAPAQLDLLGLDTADAQPAR
jgi:ectoine hydroxylase-related dioxygenase (phytanoyl-CoA dioxygenase family)